MNAFSKYSYVMKLTARTSPRFGNQGDARVGTRPLSALLAQNKKRLSLAFSDCFCSNFESRRGSDLLCRGASQTTDRRDLEDQLQSKLQNTRIVCSVGVQESAARNATWVTR